MESQNLFPRFDFNFKDLTTSDGFLLRILSVSDFLLGLGNDSLNFFVFTLSVVKGIFGFSGQEADSFLQECDGFIKGQLISKCPYEKSVWTKYQQKISKISVLEVYYFKVTTKQSLSSCKQSIDSLFVLTLN